MFGISVLKRKQWKHREDKVSAKFVHETLQIEYFPHIPHICIYNHENNFKSMWKYICYKQKGQPTTYFIMTGYESYLRCQWYIFKPKKTQVQGQYTSETVWRIIKSVAKQ